MSAIEHHHDPTSLLLRALSERECARFRNRNLRQPGRGRSIHAVELRDWLGGLQLPAPACHQPVATFALAGDAHAVVEEITCAKCRAIAGQRYAPLTALPGRDELALEFDTAEDETSSPPRLF